MTLTLSRDRLARSLARLDRLSRDAVETIGHLRAEKQELETRLAEHASRIAELERMFGQERSNFEQRVVLLQSVAAESEERGRRIVELEERNAQLETSALQHTAAAERSQEALRQSLERTAELEELSQRAERSLGESAERASALEVELAVVRQERDELRAQVIDGERHDAQWAIKLTEEERSVATRAIDTLVEQITVIESRIAQTGKGRD